MLSKERKEELLKKGYSESQIKLVEGGPEGRTYDDLRKVDYYGNQKFLNLLDEFEQFEKADKDKQLDDFMAKTKQDGITRKRPDDDFTQKVNDRLYSWWEKKEEAGETYAMPHKNAQGKLVGKRNDCSLSVSTALFDSFNGVDLPAESRNAIKSLRGATSEQITMGLADLNGGASVVIHNSAADRAKTAKPPLPEGLANLPAGSTIGIDMRPGGHQFDVGRVNGIDHIVMVVKDPKTGETMIAETKGKPESTTVIRPMSEWWDKDGHRAVKMFGINGDDLKGRLQEGVSLSQNYQVGAIKGVREVLEDEIKAAAKQAGIDAKTVGVYNKAFDNKEGLSPLEYFKLHTKGISDDPILDFQKLNEIKVNVIKEKYAPNNEYGLGTQLEQSGGMQSLEVLLTKIFNQLFGLEMKNGNNLELATNQGPQASLADPNTRYTSMGDGTRISVTTVPQKDQEVTKDTRLVDLFPKSGAIYGGLKIKSGSEEIVSQYLSKDFKADFSHLKDKPVELAKIQGDSEIKAIEDLAKAGYIEGLGKDVNLQANLNAALGGGNKPKFLSNADYLTNDELEQKKEKDFAHNIKGPSDLMSRS